MALFLCDIYSKSRPADNPGFANRLGPEKRTAFDFPVSGKPQSLPFHRIIRHPPQTQVIRQRKRDQHKQAQNRFLVGNIYGERRQHKDIRRCKRPYPRIVISSAQRIKSEQHNCIENTQKQDSEYPEDGERVVIGKRHKNEIDHQKKQKDRPEIGQQLSFFSSCHVVKCSKAGSLRKNCVLSGDQKFMLQDTAFSQQKKLAAKYFAHVFRSDKKQEKTRTLSGIRSSFANADQISNFVRRSRIKRQTFRHSLVLTTSYEPVVVGKYSA